MSLDMTNTEFRPVVAVLSSSLRWSPSVRVVVCLRTTITRHLIISTEDKKGPQEKNKDKNKRTNGRGRMRTPFDSIPHELLENIALFAVTSDPLGPPRELVPLLLVNRRMHAALSSTSNPHLHARIFAAKFDTAALVRRLGPGTATRAPKLAAELQRRCVQLGRLRAQVGCTVDAFAALAGGTGTGTGAGSGSGSDGGGGGGGLTEEGMRALHEMLWTAYLMMLENDGKNERQLREYARLDRWLRKFWFAEDGASCAQIAIRDNAWPPNNDLSAVTMWLFWFLLRPGAHHHYLFFFWEPFPPHPPSVSSHVPFCSFPPGPTITPCRKHLNLPSLLPPPPFFFCAALPRVDGASSTYHVHAHTYTHQRSMLGWTTQNFGT